MEILMNPLIGSISYDHNWSQVMSTSFDHTFWIRSSDHNRSIILPSARVRSRKGLLWFTSVEDSEIASELVKYVSRDSKIRFGPAKVKSEFLWGKLVKGSS